MWMSNIVTKEVFCEIIGTLIEVDDYHKGLNAFFEKSKVHGFLFSPDASVQTVQLLKAMFVDKDELIDKFCFEMDYGRSYKPGTVKNEDGTDLDFSSPDKLYDILVNDIE